MNSTNAGDGRSGCPSRAFDAVFHVIVATSVRQCETERMTSSFVTSEWDKIEFTFSHWLQGRVLKLVQSTDHKRLAKILLLFARIDVRKECQ